MQKSDDDLSVKEAAAYLGLTAQYIYQLRHNGKGPKCRKVEITGGGAGPRVRLLYSKPDLDAWDAARKEKKKKKAKAPPKARASRKKASADQS